MRQKTSWIVLAALGVAGVLQPGGCAGPLEDPGTTEPPVDVDLLTEVLGHAREGVILQELAAMSEELDQLAPALEAWASAPDDDGVRTDARVAFGEALVQWGALDALQVGPGAPSLDSPAGQDLRDELYSWPTVNPCRVDQETVSGDFTSPSFFETELVNVYGLDAIEHLLYAGPDNACPSQVDINADGTWDQLGPTSVQEARADYAVVLVDHLRDRLDALTAEWEGTFGDDFVAGGGPYADGQEALDDLFRATFYIELMKDEKLAYPSGLRECGTETCPELAESQAANLSADLLRSNIRALEAILTPADSYGFDDLLEDAGEEGLAEDLRTRVADARAALDGLSSVRDQADSDNAAVVAAHDAVAALATLLEADVATVLSLSVPAEAAGDND